MNHLAVRALTLKVDEHLGYALIKSKAPLPFFKNRMHVFPLQSVENIAPMFGNNSKAQVAARTVFGLAHRHSDILHEGWKNILDCMLQLYRAKLLAEVLVRVSGCRVIMLGKLCSRFGLLGYG